MEKPVTVIIDDTRTAVRDILNGARLPATILLPVIADVYNELNAAARQELAYDRQSYEKAVAEEKERKEKGGNNAAEDKYNS